MKSVQDIKDRLRHISQMGWVIADRGGDTGVGYTLENLLDKEEDNGNSPDFGHLGELKGKRKKSKCKVTSTSLSPCWHSGLRATLNKYGYPATKNNEERISFYTTIKAKPNNLGLRIEIRGSNVCIVDADNIVVADWDIGAIKHALKRKFRNGLLLVLADEKVISKKKHFHYNEGYHCSGFISTDEIASLITDNKVCFESRLHMKVETGKIRDHGFAIRFSEEHIKELYSSINKIL